MFTIYFMLRLSPKPAIMENSWHCIIIDYFTIAKSNQVKFQGYFNKIARGKSITDKSV